MLDPVCEPHAEGTPTTRDAAITAEDARGPHGFGELVLRIVATQEAVLNEASHGLAMGTRSDLEPSVQIIEFLLGSTDPATHDSLRHSAQWFVTARLPESQSRPFANRSNQVEQ